MLHLILHILLFLLTPAPASNVLFEQRIDDERTLVIRQGRSFVDAGHLPTLIAEARSEEGTTFLWALPTPRKRVLDRWSDTDLLFQAAAFDAATGDLVVVVRNVPFYVIRRRLYFFDAMDSRRGATETVEQITTLPNDWNALSIPRIGLHEESAVISRGEDGVWQITVTQKWGKDRERQRVTEFRQVPDAWQFERSSPSPYPFPLADELPDHPNRDGLDKKRGE